MISDLSPGDRLSLKGKLFELQKKLNIIDIEHRLDEQYSFQPKILNYDLPNRQKDFIENANKADIMRKQKKQMLEQSLALQSEESCTFQPKLYRSKHHNVDNRPVHIRLNDKAKAYEDAKEKRKVQFSTFDDDGNRLFTPKINSKRSNRSTHEPSDASVQSNIGADEFLYQDAKDRELRFQNRIAKNEEDIAKESSITKINSNSEKMLRRKMEKYSSQVFNSMDEDQNGEIDYNDVVSFIEKWKICKSVEEQAINNQLFWSVIDQHKDGKVVKRDFIVICTGFLLEKTASSISSLIKKYERKSVSDQANDGFIPIAPYIHSLKEKDINGFRELLSQLINKLNEGDRYYDPLDFRHSYSKHNKSNETNDDLTNTEDTFKPKIYSLSYKLAERKEQKDLKLLSELLPGEKQLGLSQSGGFDRSQQMRSFSIDMSQLTIEDLDHTQNNASRNNDTNITVLDTTDLQKSPVSRTSKQDNRSVSMASVSGITMSGTSITSKHEKLFTDALLMQKKREKLIEDIKKQEFAECTFRPDRAAKYYNPKKTFNTVSSKNGDSSKNNNNSDNNSDNDNDDIENDGNPTESGNNDQMHQNELDESPQILEVHVYQDPETEENGENDQDPEMSNELEHSANNISDISDPLVSSPPPPPPADDPNKNLDQSVPPTQAVPVARKVKPKSQKSQEPDDSEEPSIYDRLYAYKDKKPKALTEIQPTYLQELQACTFRPNLQHTKSLSLLKSKMQKNSSDQKPIEGFDKTVERMRKSIQDKERKKVEESDETQRKIAEDKYLKSRELSKKGQQPFHSHLTERISKHQQKVEEHDHSKPDLIVDVKLSANRNARIRVTHGDDPVELANKFAKIYSLDKDASKVLETVLRQSMIQRGILPDPNKTVIAVPDNAANSARERKHSIDSGIGSSGSRHRRHRRHRHSSRSRKGSNDERDYRPSIPEMIGGDDAYQGDDLHLEDLQHGNSNQLHQSNSNNSSSKIHRLDTEHSEMFGDTSMGVVEDDYSSYTESSQSESSDSEVSDYSVGDNDYQVPFNRNYRHDIGEDEIPHGASIHRLGSMKSRNSYRDRSSILSELL